MRRRYRPQFLDVLEPVTFHELDPAGNRWPTLDEIEDFHGFIRWELNADDPSAPWGWAWIIDRTRYLACEELTIAPADWTRLSNATNPRIATATALFALLRPDRPPFRTDRQFLKHVADAFDSTAPLPIPIAMQSSISARNCTARSRNGWNTPTPLSSIPVLSPI